MNLRLLKFSVAFMGVLIVIGMIVVVVTIARRMSALGDSAGPTPPAGTPYALQVAVPEGCEAAELQAVGNRLAVRLGGGAQCRELLILDPRSGTLVGSIALTPTPAP